MKTLTVKTYISPLSDICFGAGAVGDRGLGAEALKHAFSVLDGYYSLGGRFLDTAAVYGRWGAEPCNASERVIGAWLLDRGISDMTVATKCCHFEPDTPHISRVDKASMLYDIGQSLKALKTDRLDILYLHRDDESKDIREIVDFCIFAVENGYTARFGFSNFRSDRVKTALEYMGDGFSRYFFGVSNERSLAMEGLEGYSPSVGMVAYDKALGELQDLYGFVHCPFSSVSQGFFSKLKKCGAVYDGEWKNTDGFFGDRSRLTSKNGEMYNRLIRLSNETGFGLTALSLGYLLSQRLTLPIVAASSSEHIRELSRVSEFNWNDFFKNT